VILKSYCEILEVRYLRTLQTYLDKCCEEIFSAVSATVLRIIYPMNVHNTLEH
jgi:hypothetical protein